MLLSLLCCSRSLEKAHYICSRDIYRMCFDIFAKASRIKIYKQHVFWSFQYTADAASSVHDPACAVTLSSVSASRSQGSTAHPDPARAEGIPASGRRRDGRTDGGCPSKSAQFTFFEGGVSPLQNCAHAGNARKMAEPE